MTKQANSFFLFLIGLLMLSCQGNEKKNSLQGEEITFKYAQLVKMWAYEDFQKLEIQNPWDTAYTLQTYLLVDKDKKLPEELPEGIVLRTPLQNAVVYTTVHCALLCELTASEAISGVCDLEYIQPHLIKERCAQGKIADLGSSMGPDIEKMISLNPDAVLLSPFKNSGGHGELDKFGMPIFECADYMEKEALGRAEWIRIYGKLFGQEAKADSIFSQVENDFNKMQTEAAKDSSSPRPVLLYGMRNGSAWYVPGGNSYMAKLFKAAGADYLFAQSEHSGSEPLAFETVFDKGYNADIWLFLYNQEKDKTYKDLESYSDFKSYKTKNIFACNTGKIPYYDETPFHPERLLYDLCLLFHAKKEPISDEKLHYYRNLAE